MEVLLQATLNGLLMGAIYGLIALGLGLVWGVMRVCNFAQGSLVMLGMYAAFWAWKLLHLNPYLALLLTIPLFLLLGIGLQKFLFNPVFRADETVREPIAVFLLTAGLMNLLDNLALVAFGANYQVIRGATGALSVRFGPALVSLPRLYGAIIAGISTAAVALFLSRTLWGKALRAVSQDREVARLMAINDYRMNNLASAIGTALAGVAGAVLATFYYTYPAVGMVFLMRAFVIVILGGIGSIPGTLLGGLIIGLVESVGAQVMSAAYTEALIYAIFTAVLLLRPTGLLGVERE